MSLLLWNFRGIPPSKGYPDDIRGKMKKKFMIFSALVTLFTMLMTACAPAATFDLHGTTWMLVSYGSTATPVVKNTDAALTFAKDGKVSGNVGCNSISGEYSLVGDQITFGPLASTLMACSDELMRQEGAVFNVLTGSVKFKAEAGILTIFSSANAPVLTFTQVMK